MSRTRTPHLVLVALMATFLLPSCGSKSSGAAGEFPEDRFTYPVSHFAIRRDPEDPIGSMRKILLAIEDLDSGMPFDEVARRRGDAPPGAEGSEPTGGWMGFMRPEQPVPMTGAFQVLRPGEYGGPFEQDGASHFLLRHTFEDGRRIEEENVIPAYGFLLPNDPNHPDPALRDIRPQALEALEKVKRGEMTIAEASELLGVSTPRTDAFLRNVRDIGPEADLYKILAEVDPGEMAPLGELKGAYLFARRGVYLRSHVRHIVIQHIETGNRPLSVSRPKQEARELAEKVLKQLQDGDLTWEEAVPRYSDEVATLPLHGWIGAIANGDLIPEFEAAILATKPGELADEILETGDGFHVIYRVN